MKVMLDQVNPAWEFPLWVIEHDGRKYYQQPKYVTLNRIERIMNDKDNPVFYERNNRFWFR